jgi:signal transduction histidine kinase
MRTWLQFHRHVGIRAKFVVSFSILLIGCIVIISSYLIKRQSEGYRRELEASGETLTRLLAMQSESGVLFESTYELDEVLKQLEAFEDIHYAVIKNDEGRVLSEIGTRPPENIRLIRSVETEDLQQQHYSDQDYYVELPQLGEFIRYIRPVVSRIERIDRENLGITQYYDSSLVHNFVLEEIGTITIFLSLKQVNQSIADASTVAIQVTLAVALLAMILMTLLVRIITDPVQELVDVTNRVSRGDLTQRVAVRQNDEIGQLGHTFNQMIESLQQSRQEIEDYNRNLEAMIIERTEELEQTQAQLVQSEKMSAIGQLAAGVAHELNNPLGGILGFAQFTLEKLNKTPAGKTGEKEIAAYKRYLTDIETQARRCKTIVQNLLRFSRSSRTSDFDTVNLNNVVKDTCTFVEHQLSMNQIELTLELDSNLPDIKGNSGQLQQVITNLVINAMHASPADSTIRVCTGPVTSESTGKPSVAVKVIDQGVGIPPENLGKLFEPFFTTKEVGKGTGLGLSVSYGIIRDHNGEILVDSTPGLGTTFTVIVPVQETPDASDNLDMGSPISSASDSEQQ